MEQEKYSKKELRAIMEETGYPMASIEKTLRLLSLLKAINSDDFLKDNLVLKGGTAINIIHYLDIPRLSVDLDFDLALNTSKEEMLKVREETSKRLHGISSSLGYSLSDPRPNYAIYQTELFYLSATGNRDKIKLDINCLSRCHIFETVVKETVNPFYPERVTRVRILSEYELFGAKMKALLERNTPRDIFDAYMLERKGLFRDTVSISMIRKCVVYYLSLTDGIDIAKALEAIRNRPMQDFKRQLFPMLKTGYGFVDHSKMVSDAIECVSRFLSFTPEEAEYLEAAKSGIYRPELLFDDVSAERMKDNPAAKFFISGKQHSV